MTTAVSNTKLPVTQNRIGKLKKRINQMKIGGPKKDVRKVPPRVYEDDSQIPKIVARKHPSKDKLMHHQHPLARQPLGNIQPNSYRHDPDPTRLQAESYRKHTDHKIYSGMSVDSDEYYTNNPEVDYWSSDAFHVESHRERKAIGIVPPCPIGESEIDLQSLGASIGELFPPSLHPLSLPPDRHAYTQDWYKNDEYRDDAIAYILEQDRLYTIKSTGYLYNGDIQTNMRTILVDWIIQVQVHQDLLDQTLHLTVALLDRYHSQHVISLPKYQLLGVGCLFVAAKYWERFPPLMADLVKLTENTYTPEQLLTMELKILAVLHFDLTFIDPHSLMERYLHMFGYHKDKMVRYLSMYIIDLSLTEPKCIVVRRASLAMNAVCLAKMILDENAEYHLMPLCRHEVVVILAKILVNTETAELTAAKVKYSSMSRYHGVSHLPSITTSPIVTSLAADTSLPVKKHRVTFV